ncbi:NAD(P)/FAD-dependent oxidoreductase [Planktosalinus lacus]|uniref:FAD-dependent oxidoreductase n=1 Tax=Planktosalinus lacus TaxID=1526573 RepID=A0A8J2V8Q4_9FLAO|nr:FAD-dependent oxidoreductase [Planktosalinus lacus]GGD86311.1 FAD-dependent oxidoreductase [Planktosalinus lacus]
MKVDYIIVGLGLAGIAFCESLRANNKSFVVIDSGINTSSTIAGGLFNPVILKRFTPAWNAENQLKSAIPFYEKLEQKLKVKLIYNTPVFRLFASVEEQNLWFEVSDKPGLEPFIAKQIHHNTNPHIHAPFGFGEVLQSGRVDTGLLLETYRMHLLKENQLIEAYVQYDELIIDKSIEYKDISASKIVFAEGFGLNNNPFFNFLPLPGNKGELITIQSDELKLDTIIKSGVFIIPDGGNYFRVGSTYNHRDKTTDPTDVARTELLKKLNKFLTCEFEVIEHQAGIRPTTKDRKPLLGRHPKFENMYVLNGLGSRGVLIAPTVAGNLYDFIEASIPLDYEVSIERFL